MTSPLRVKCQVLRSELKTITSVWILSATCIDVSAGTQLQFRGPLRAGKKKESSLYLSRKEKYEQIDSVPFLLVSDK